MSRCVNWWERLRAERQKVLKLNQELFASRVNELSPGSALSQGTVSNYELGKTPHPSVEAIAPIAKALGVRIEWLMTGTGPKAGSSEPSHPAVDTFTTEMAAQVRTWAESIEIPSEVAERHQVVLLREHWKDAKGHIPPPRPSSKTDPQPAELPPQPTRTLDAHDEDPREQAILLLLKGFDLAEHTAIRQQLPVAALDKKGWSVDRWLEEFRRALKKKPVAERGDRGGKGERERAIDEARVKAGFKKPGA